ncbi:MAG: hypothetical protein HZC41_02060 [Chloroflexi bacterium]|nr:hypothetical protein [Chloroflexota bacterium]
MTEYVVLEMTPEERERLETLARLRGYTAPADYVRALIESDAVAQGITPDDDDDLEAGFLQGWHDAMTGNTIPASELRKALLDDDE